MGFRLSGVLIAVAILASAAPAMAGTMGFGQQPFHGQYGFGYNADPGEANDVTATFTPDAIVVVDRGVAQVTAGERCQATADPQKVECPLDRWQGDKLRAAVGLEANLGDGNDAWVTVNLVDPALWADRGRPIPGGWDPSDYGDQLRLIGAEGDDTLTGGSGYDWVIGGGGADTVDGGPARDFVLGGFQPVRHPAFVSSQADGDDTVRGGGGDDLVDGGAGDDAVEGGEGHDDLSGGRGADDYSGGPGTDVMGFATGMDFDGYAPSQPVTADIGGGANDGGPADGPPGARDDIGEDVEGMRGGWENDTLTGNSLANAIDGFGGDDVIDGGGGDDVLVGGQSEYIGDPYDRGDDRDTVLGGPGNDALDGGDDHDTVDGGPGDDLLDGGATFGGGDDLIVGGDGDDRLFGGHNTLRIQGGPVPILPDGPDTFDGGDGRDVVVTRDEVWDPEACRATGVFDPDTNCHPETPQNCQPGSPACGNPTDTGTCGPADDTAYLEGDDTLTECETVDPPGPVPTATAGFSDGTNAVGTTNAAGGASAAHAVATSVTAPVAGGVTVDQQPATAQTAGNLELLPVAITTRAPVGSATKPAQVAFSVDAARVPADLSGVGVLRDGAPVADCTGPDGYASPDPCVVQRSRVAGGDAALSVRSSAPGNWRLAVPAGSTPSAGNNEADGNNAAADRTRPTLRLALRSRYSLRALIRGLRVPVTCSEPCTATVELRLGTKAAKKLRLKATVGRRSKSLRGRGSVTVKPTRGATQKLRRLRRGFALLVVAKAIDGAGNKSRTASKRISVR